MDEGFSSPTGIQWHGSTGVVEYGGDRNMIAMFYNRPVHNAVKSQAAGRPIYEDLTYVRIHPPGERLNIVDRPVKDADRNRFPMQWHQYQQNKEQKPDGTPIDLLYPDHPSIGATLKASNVYTIEQCAELSGTAIDTIGMGAQRYCNDSKKYLEAANKGVGASQMRHELEERDREIRLLKQQLDQMKNEVANMQASNANGVNLATLQAMISGAMGRPQYLQGQQPAFDAATAQINANHPTATVKRPVARGRPRSKLG